MSELPPLHPLGEAIATEIAVGTMPLAVDTFGGKLHVEWDPEAAVTPMGQLSFFIQFLKYGNLFLPWVESCPLHYISNNSSKKVDVLGTILLSVLSGHYRFAHIARLAGDDVNRQLLGMHKIISDDSVCRALKKIDEQKGAQWLQRHLQYCWGPLLSVPWILDADVTVKPLFGHQEGAEIGYNPHKPGRPSHTYHTYFIGNLRVVLDVEIHTGIQGASRFSAPGLWDLLSRIPRVHWPRFIRGDSEWGTEEIMREAEARDVAYLFKLKQHLKVKHCIAKQHRMGGWQRINTDWEVTEDQLQLMGWNQSRRVVIMRRRLPKDSLLLLEKEAEEKRQPRLALVEGQDDIRAYEYSVLVTSLRDEPLSIFYHYRDRADAENNFDELKNHWGWGGFTSRTLTSCRLMASNL